MNIKVHGVKLYRSRHGKWYAYHRATGRRLRAPIGTAAFLAEVEQLDSDAEVNRLPSRAVAIAAEALPAPRPGILRRRGER